MKKFILFFFGPWLGSFMLFFSIPSLDNQFKEWVQIFGSLHGQLLKIAIFLSESLPSPPSNLSEENYFIVFYKWWTFWPNIASYALMLLIIATYGYVFYQICKRDDKLKHSIIFLFKNSSLYYAIIFLIVSTLYFGLRMFVVSYPELDHIKNISFWTPYYILIDKTPNPSLLLYLSHLYTLVALIGFSIVSCIIAESVVAFNSKNHKKSS